MLASPKIVTVSSGKGGVGKTLTTVNFAAAFARMGLRVLILDGDLGLANVDVVLGLQARYNIKDAIDGHVSMQDVVIEGPMGIKILPSGSGISRLSNLSLTHRRRLLELTASLNGQFDVLLIDTGAGISETVLHFNCASHTRVVVTTPEPHAMTDAYALIKVLSEEHAVNDFQVLVNQARSTLEGQKVFERIAAVAERFLSTNVSLIGCVPSDPMVQRAVMNRAAITEQTSTTLAGQAWNQIARSLYEQMQQSSERSSASHIDTNNDPWASLLRLPNTVSPLFRVAGA